jgi:predicted site-specific integrase-resolvase
MEIKKNSLLNRKEVAFRLGFKSTESIKRMVRSGKLSEISINSRVKRYENEDVDEIIKKGKEQ